MQAQEVTYTIALTDVDQMTTRMVLRKGKVIEFSVHYRALINRRWRAIARYDTKHGSPHRHIFSADGTEYRTAFPCANYNEGMTAAQKIVREEFRKMKSNYLMTG